MVSFSLNPEPKEPIKNIDSTGNKKVTIPVHKVILTCRIQETILAYQPNFNFEKFIIVEDNSLPLSRMETMLNDDLYKTNNRPPIDIERSYNDLYQILNGRHRLVRAILLGNKKINVKIY